MTAAKGIVARPIVAEAIDTVLDRTIVFGYSDVGLHVRRRLAIWPAEPPPMVGKVVLVTGAASGIGLAACCGFGRLGARILAVARDQQRAEEAAAKIGETVPNANVRPIGCDVSSTRSLRLLADRLAPFALTSWLSGLLARSAPGRVINVSSGGMYAQAIPAGDLQSARTPYSPRRLYARTKREQVVLTEMWAEGLEHRGIVVHAMHPGWADTNGVRECLPAFRALIRPIIRTLEEGADTIVWLGSAPEPLTHSGLFWHDWDRYKSLIEPR